MLRETHYPLNLWPFNTLFFSETVPVSRSYCYICKPHASLLIRGQIPIPLRASWTPFVVPPYLTGSDLITQRLSSSRLSLYLLSLFITYTWTSGSESAHLSCPTLLLIKHTITGNHKKQDWSLQENIVIGLILVLMVKYFKVSYITKSREIFPVFNRKKKAIYMQSSFIVFLQSLFYHMTIFWHQLWWGAHDLLKGWVIPVSQYWAHDLSMHPFKLTWKQCNICFKSLYGSGTSLSLRDHIIIIYR